jgi:hypothetical protein
VSFRIKGELNDLSQMLHIADKKGENTKQKSREFFQ